MTPRTAVARVHDAPLPALTRDADTLPDVFRLAEMLVPTGMLPDTIRTAGQCVAIILAGRELAMPPMRALRSLVLVKGKVVESADSQLARFKTDGGRAQFKTLDETKAVLWLRHPNGDEHTETFTIEDAKKAGLAGKGTWQQFPKAMLRSRVITSALKSIGWEGGAGAYDPDEALAFAPLATATAEDTPIHQTPKPAAEKLFPFDGPFKGKPIGTMPLHAIEGYVAWIEKKQAEKGDDSLFGELLDALNAVLPAARDVQAAKEAQDASGDGPQHSAAGSGDPSPSSGAAPYYSTEPLSPDEFAKLSAAQLQARAVRLIGHGCMKEPFASATVEQINAGLSFEELRKLVRQLDAMIAAAPLPKKKGEKRAHSIGDLPGDPA